MRHPVVRDVRAEEPLHTLMAESASPCGEVEQKDSQQEQQQQRQQPQCQPSLPDTLTNNEPVLDQPNERDDHQQSVHKEGEQNSDSNGEESPKPTNVTEEVLQHLTVDELIIRSKEHRARREFEEAVTTISCAVEKRLQELGGDDHATDPDLAPLYLDYGDLLLTIAENSNDLFRMQHAPTNLSSSSSSSSSVPQPPQPSSSGTHSEEDSVPDEQLAWEVLELARMAYTKALAALYAEQKLPFLSNNGSLWNDKSPVKKLVEGASFTHLRLGDLLLVEEHFEEAEKEFQEALDVLKKAEAPYTTFAPVLIALAQAQLLQLKAETAVATFEEALRFVVQHLNAVEGFTLTEEQRQRYEATAEDLQIQIDEVKKNIADGLYTASQQVVGSSAVVKPERTTASTSSSSSTTLPLPASVHVPAQQTLLTLTGVKPEPNSLTSPFDRPQLGSTTIDLGVVGKRSALSPSESQDMTKKRPRHSQEPFTTGEQTLCPNKHE